MYKKIISLVLALSMALSLIPVSTFSSYADSNYAYEAGATVTEDVYGTERKVDTALDELRGFYKDYQIDYIPAMAYNHSSDNLDNDIKIIKKNLRTYNSTKNVYNCYKGIMEAIACDKDPRSFQCNGEELNYVDTLIEKQDPNTGEFNSDIETHAYCMLALDMASGDYDKQKAVDVLKNSLNVKDGKASCSDDLKKTAVVMTALSNHKSINGVSALIDNCVAYIKSKQKDDAGFFKDEPEILGPVIQALIAVGENPVAEDYIKNGNTMVDVLLQYKNSDGTYNNSPWYKKYVKESTEAAFAAFADLKKDSSMFHELMIEVGDTPADILLSVDTNEIIEGKTLKVKATVVDNQGRLVSGQKVNWQSADPVVAEVENGIITAIKEGSTTIKAQLEGNATISKSIDITVVSRLPASIKIYLDDEEVKDTVTVRKGESIELHSKVFDKDDEQIQDSVVTWEIVNGSDNVQINNGQVTGMNKGYATIKVQCQDVVKTANISVILITDLVKDALDETKAYFDDRDLDYYSALALRHCGIEESTIKDNIKINSYTSNPEDYAENIIALIAAGLNPRDYNGNNYVDELVKSQDDSGYFKIGYNYTYPENIILPIIALDMAGANYDKIKALSALQIKVKVVGDNKCFEGHGDYNNIEMTSLGIIAMSNHMQIEEISQLVAKCKGYLKYKQNDNAAFEAKSGYGYDEKENCRATASVVQALISINEDPLSSEWMKNGKNLFDALCSFRKEDGFKETPSSYSVDAKATSRAVGALADLVNNKSMFNEYGIEIGTVPHSIEIIYDQDSVKEGQKIKLSAKVLDEDGKLVPNVEIEWSSSDPSIAEIDQKGFITGIEVEENKTVQITVKTVNLGISATKDITIKARIPYEMKINLPSGKTDKTLKDGHKIVLFAKIFEQDGEEIEHENVIWKSSDENVAIVDQTGLVTAQSVEKDTEVTITAISQNKQEVKESIVLNILAIIPNEIKIYSEEQEIEAKTIEAGYKLKLEAKAFEADGAVIDKAEIVWDTSNKNIVNIDKNGLAEAKEVDEDTEVTITAKIDGFTTEKALTLKVVPKQSSKQKTQKIINDLNAYYEKDAEYDYLEAMALNRIGFDVEDIQKKFSITKVNFNTGWDGSKSIDYSKAIMGLVGLGLDPRDYENKNYVEYLSNSQVEKGHFNPSKYSYTDDDEADFIGYSIIALDMAGAEYDINKATEALKDMFYISGNRAFVKKSSYSSDPDLRKTAIAIIALSNHTGKNGIQDLIDKTKVYIKEQYNEWDIKTDCETIAYTIQALVALGEDISSDEWIRIDGHGNRLSMLDFLLKLKLENGFKENIDDDKINNEVTALAFIAAVDVNTGKSTFKDIKIETGAPVRVEISSQDDNTEIKAGKTLQLSAKAYDENDKFVPSQKFTWSVDKPSIANIDSNTGLVTAVSPGTVVITAVIEDSNVKNNITLKVVSVTPNKVEISIDKNITQIEIGKKIKINVKVYDKDDEIIENPSLEWSINPSDSASIDEKGILTGLKEGQATIAAFVGKNDGSKLSSSVSLEIIRGKKVEENIKEAIAGATYYFSTQKNYDFITSLGLRYSETGTDKILSNINVYSADTLHNNSRNIMNIVAAGENPTNYNGKNYVDLILNSNTKFYKDSNTEYIAKAIIALDMSSASYDKQQAVDSLIAKLTEEDGKYYAVSYSSPDTEVTAWTLIALSYHKNISGVDKVIEGIKNYLLEEQEENGLIEKCEYTSLVVQALIALGENPLEGNWVKYDIYGNEVTLLDGILACKDGNRFKSTLSASQPGYYTTQYALAALADLNKNKSMYHELNYVEAGEAAKIKIDSEDLTLVVGEEKDLEAQAFDDQNNIVRDAEIVWKSSKPELVKIENGKLIALGIGEAKIRAELKNNESIFDEITVNVNESQNIDLKVKAAISKLISFYDEYSSYDYMSALSLRHLNNDFDVNKEKLASNLRLYTRDYAIHYAKNIMEIIAADLNPRLYPLKNSEGEIIEYKNYVRDLVEAQNENGEFLVNEVGDKDSIVSLSLSIMALDMADADYEVEKAVNRLVYMLNDTKYDKDGLYNEVETKALAITALSKHKNISGVKEIINTSLEYIKSKQNEDGGFDHSGYDNNPFAIGTVVQALIANDIDPMTWVKNGNTMVEVLIERQLENGEFEYGENPPSTPNDEIFGDFKCTETAFAALADVYRDKSMYYSIGVNDEIKERIEAEIEFLKKHYEEYAQFEFLAAPAANLAGMSKELLKEKVFRYTKTDSAFQSSKTIVSLIGSGLDPRNDVIDEDEVRNYVYELKSSQMKSGDNKGEFVLKESDKNSIQALVNSIIALDMADAKYDEESAVKRLIEMIEAKDSHTYREIQLEGFALIALANHKDIEGVNEEIDKLINFLKAKQNEDGGFDINDGWYQGKNSPIAIGGVIQGLIANGINPLYSGEWIKNGNTVLDALLKSKVVKEDIKVSGYSKGEGDTFAYYGSTYQAFAALVDLYNNETMFDKLAIKYDSPSADDAVRIEIEEPDNTILYLGKTLELNAKVYDKNNKIIEDVEVQWISSDDSIATVENGIVLGKLPGKVTITAKLENSDLEDSLSISVTNSSIRQIRVETLDKGLRPGDKTKLTAKALDDNDDVIEGKSFKWISSNRDIAEVDSNTGEVTAMSSGTVVIRAILEDNESLEGRIELNIVPKKEAYVYVRIEGYNKTVVEKAKIKVDNFNMNPYAQTVDMGPDALVNPTAAHAVIKALQLEGYDVLDKNQVDITSFFLSKIGEDDTKGSAGWMFRVNGKMPDVYMQDVELKDEDNVLIYYVKDYNKGICTELLPSKNVVDENEAVQFTLKDLDSDKVVKNAAICVNDKIYKINDKPVLTDANGKATIIFESKGEYKISAARTEASQYFITPDPITIVVGEISVPTKIVITEVKKNELKVNEKLQLEAEVYANENLLIGEDVIWSSSDTEIASIDDKGLVTALKLGKVTITAAVAKNTSISDNIQLTIRSEEQTDQERIESAIEDLRGYYSKDKEFTFREAIGYRFTSEDLENDLSIIQQKYKVKGNPQSASDYVGNIIGLIAAGKNPKDYNGTNYVEVLVKSQNKDGKFMIGKYDDYATTVAFSILALDMANGKYDVNNAVRALLSYQDRDGSFGGPDETAMSIMALGKHRDISGVDASINNAIEYLKRSQTSNGGFVAFGKENPYSVSAVIQGLVAVGEDPLSESWIKNENTMLDSLLSFKEDDHFKNVSEWGTDIDMSTEQAFMALADLYRGKSMFNEIGLEETKPSKIEIQASSTTIKENGKLKLNANVYDKQDKLVTGFNLIWNSSDSSIAEIDQNGLVTAKKVGKVTINVKVKGYEAITDTIELTVESEEIKIIRVGNEPIKKGTEARLEINIKNNSKESKTATFIIVLYDKNTNKMINYSYVKQTLEASEDKNMGAGFLIPEKGDYIIKGLVWDGFESQDILLANPLIIEVE
ncbi:Ig-like domain-containing protein [Brassicibacter mesophilus]|uniref:Ig-like domain-containing protein n=1 Tax=Brassicibacter mesophilus TaxID=745119 RepID=UPI003D1B38EB